MKTYTASPPDTLRIDEKHLREYAIFNCCGVIITSNYKTDGIFLSPDDRRTYVAWSDRTKEDECFQGGYWNRLYGCYAGGGSRHVAAYLMQRDISNFDPKAPPPKTEAFWAIVDANRAGEESELADTIERMQASAFTLKALQDEAEGGLAEWLADRKNRRAIPHRLERCDYVPVRNPDANDGLWKINNKRQTIYAKVSLSLAERVAIARGMANRGRDNDTPPSQ
jgi:hypothetical protein